MLIHNIVITIHINNAQWAEHVCISICRLHWQNLSYYVCMACDTISRDFLALYFMLFVSTFIYTKKLIPNLKIHIVNCKTKKSKQTNVIFSRIWFPAIFFLVFTNSSINNHTHTQSSCDRHMRETVCRRHFITCADSNENAMRGLLPFNFCCKSIQIMLFLSFHFSLLSNHFDCVFVCLLVFISTSVQHFELKTGKQIWEHQCRLITNFK